MRQRAGTAPFLELTVNIQKEIRIVAKQMDAAEQQVMKMIALCQEALAEVGKIGVAFAALRESQTATDEAVANIVERIDIMETNNG